MKVLRTLRTTFKIDKSTKICRYVEFHSLTTGTVSLEKYLLSKRNKFEYSRFIYLRPQITFSC